jgi:NADH-quinone oxidoreductase subunit M
MLSAIIFAPLIGALAILLIKPDRAKAIKWTAVAAATVPLLFTLYVTVTYKIGGGMQFVEKHVWSSTLGSSYHLGLDGLSLPMFFLSALLGLIAVAASWNIDLKPKGYFSLLLLLEVGMLGVFASLDYIFFYIFWELVLLPMFFLIGIWGGNRREYAAVKFFIYTLAGSLLMLISILAVYFYAGGKTFSILELQGLPYANGFQTIVFWGFFLGFAVKVPMFPLHTWLPDAHVEAPTAVSVLLAGVLLKMGAYGFLRILVPTLPNAFRDAAWFIAVLAVISIIYGAFNAMTQKDLKKMVAYSSVSHMGYVMLGIASMTAAGISGAAMQMFSHGLITAMLFLLVGYIYERSHTRQIADLGGLLNKIPLLAGLLCFASFASLGMPGLSGFIAEFLVFAGAYAPFKILSIIASAGVVITAGYLLWMLQRVVMGDLPAKWEALKDANAREILTLAPLAALILIVGLFPSTVMAYINQAVNLLAGR